jgi:hypothetical protein
MMKLDYGRQIIAAGKVNAKLNQNQKAKGKRMELDFQKK